MSPACFLDRDGVLIKETHLLHQPEQVELLEGAAAAIRRAQQAGLMVVVVSNQTVVARGLCSEDDVRQIHRHIDGLLVHQGCSPLAGWYFCPHHPHADVESYRVRCTCRKPEPGLLRDAARDLLLDLGRSTMIGDRMSDVLAGQRAGCRSVLLQGPATLDPPIVGMPEGNIVVPDRVHGDLTSAVAFAIEVAG